MAIFDWFRRKTSEKPQDASEQAPVAEPKSQPEEAAESGSAADSETTTTQEIDYLTWAKAAYKNIQEKKGQADILTSEEPSRPIAEVAEATPPSTTVEPAAISQAFNNLIPTTAEPESPDERPVIAEAAEPTVMEAVAPIPEPEPSVSDEESVAEISAESTTSNVVETETEPEPEPAPIAEESVDETLVEIPTAASEQTFPSAPVEETAPDELEAAPKAQPSFEPTEEAIALEPESTIDDTALPTSAEPAATEAVPAWLQKSGGLEKLKETAIDTEGLEFDEDFLWSAKVLADQGRDVNDISLEEIEWLKKLRDGLGKTRRSLVNQLKSVVGQGPLNDEAVLEIESLLLQADVGIDATDYIIETLQAKLREEALPPEEAIAYLKEILRNILDAPLAKLATTEFAPEAETLNIWMLTGVNGAGKTTTIGKLAHLAQRSGYSCVIAAADTFRAAAVEQVKIWGDRTGTPVIANPGKNTDPAAVVFDGITAATSRNAQILLVDTAGRLQNKKNLMDELAKIRRIIDKKAPDATVESLLVLDATLGQNGLRQAQVFSEAAKLSGVVLTKLDGTARGGVALAVSQQLGLPIRFIGAGEGIEDLRPFSSYEFVEALLDG